MRASIVWLAWAVCVCAQNRPEFDAASIKPNTSGRAGILIDISKSGDFTAENATLHMLVAFAYNVKEFQVSGGPKWADSERYDVFAKPPRDGDGSFDTNRLRMRALLADRFQLVAHTETKELPVYALVVGKNGPHLEVSKGDNPRKGIYGQRGSLTCTAVSMKDLAAWGLAPRLGNIVLDKTGLQGEFDFKLQYADDSPLKPGADPTEAPSDPGGPSLASALQEQLGLKLETQKAPVPVIVIDRAEKASAN